MSGLDIVILGLSLSSSWGNGHATTYRALVRALQGLGHRVLFLERDVPWYAEHRDLPDPPYCRLKLYRSTEELQRVYASAVRSADAVIVGSYVPDGIRVGRWAQETAAGVVAFYDIDTPITVSSLRRGDAAASSAGAAHEGGEVSYICRELIPGYDLYLSFAGGPVLTELETAFGSPCARALLCSVDIERYAPPNGSSRRVAQAGANGHGRKKWALGYLGTYSDDRQPGLEELLLNVARRMPNERFVVAGPKYPRSIRWPANVDRIEHLPPAEHQAFYWDQAATLNLTRAAMRRTGHAPSVRLFEAAACGTPIISDVWPGLTDLFTPGEEILLARRSEDVLEALQRSAVELEQIGRRGRERVLSEHTSVHRARQLERWLHEAAEAGVATGSVRAGGATA